MIAYRNYFADRDKYLEKKEDKERELIYRERKTLLENDSNIEVEEMLKDKDNLSKILPTLLDKNYKLDINKIEAYYKRELGAAAFENLKSRFYSQLKIKKDIQRQIEDEEK